MNVKSNLILSAFPLLRNSFRKLKFSKGSFYARWTAEQDKIIYGKVFYSEREYSVVSKNNGVERPILNNSLHTLLSKDKFKYFEQICFPESSSEMILFLEFIKVVHFMKIMKAKFPGKCKWCGDPISPNDLIAYVRPRLFGHYDCVPEGRTHDFNKVDKPGYLSAHYRNKEAHERSKKEH